MKAEPYATCTDKDVSVRVDLLDEEYRFRLMINDFFGAEVSIEQLESISNIYETLMENLGEDNG